MENIRYTTSLLTNMFLIIYADGSRHDYTTGSRVSDDFVQLCCFDTHNSIAMSSANPSIDKNFNIQKNTTDLFASIGQTKYNIEILNNIKKSDFELINFKQKQLKQILDQFYSNTYLPF